MRPARLTGESSISPPPGLQPLARRATNVAGKAPGAPSRPHGAAELRAGFPADGIGGAADAHFRSACLAACVVRSTVRTVGGPVAAFLAAACLLGLLSGGWATSKRAARARGTTSNSLGDLYTLSIDGGSLRKLTPRGRTDTGPSVSPSGLRMAYGTISSARVDDLGLRTVLAVSRIDGSDTRTVTRQLFQPTELAWSRDGRRLSFLAVTFRPPYGVRRLYVADLTAGRVPRLAGSANASGPGWSRDGRLAFTDRGSGRASTVVADAEGKPLWRTAGFFVGWSPDGRKILVRRGATLCTGH